MSQDFKKQFVLDDRLACTSEINYAVEQGGQNITTADFNAVSQGTSSHTYSIQVPSEQTIIDRRVIWTSTAVLKLVGTPAVGEFLVNVGLNDALAPFPLHQLCSTISATINNNTVSTNIRDVLSAIVRMNDKRDLQRYNGLTPVAFDTYKSYADGVLANNNPLGSFSNVADNDLLPRGAHPLIIGTALLGSGLPDATALQTVGDGATLKTVYIAFTVSEPLLLSPFIFCNPMSNNQGFYGIQNMNIQMNISDSTRVWRTSRNYLTVGANAGVSVSSFQGSKLTFQFLTPHSNLLLPSRNVVPYYELPRYISSPNVAFSASETKTIQTNTIALNQIPDKLFIMVRKPMSSQLNQDTDSWFKVNNVSINFNNSSGILSSSNIQDLYRFSVESGSNQNWYEFSGQAVKSAPLSGNGSSVNTSGSLVVLSFGRHIQLTESFYAPGSLGNFSLQVNVNCTNNSGSNITPEICIITMNSGCFISERGTSQTYTALLSKADVLEAGKMEPYKRSDVRRLVGGGWMDDLKSAWNKYISPHLTMGNLKKGLTHVDNDYAKKGADVLGALGYGKSGGLQNRLM